MSYRLPLISKEQYRLLPADEQYLLISSIHSLYAKMLGAAPAEAAPEPSTPTPQNVAPEPRARRGAGGGIRALIIKAFEGVSELDTDQIYARVTRDAPFSTHGVRALTHRLLREGVLERVGRARYRLKR